jgi:isoquinoline 1-oxidoreductase beta subunit
VRIDSDGNVLIGARDPDTGTGVATSLPRIIADELDADWNRVRVVAARPRRDRQQRSATLDLRASDRRYRRLDSRRLGDLRQAGALARWLLVQAAAQRLGVPPTACAAKLGFVIAPDGRRLDLRQPGR